MTAEPLHSAMAFGAAEDTSLALPSDNRLRSGQQRVLDQVCTIKRSKSKQGKNGTLLPSPTSPSPQGLTVFDSFASFKFSPSKQNGVFSRSTSTVSANYSKTGNVQRNRSQSAKSMGRRHLSSSSQWERSFNSSTWPKAPNQMIPSRSDSNLAPPPAPAPAPGTLMRNKSPGVVSQTLLTTRNRNSSYMSSNNTNTVTTTTTTRVVRPPSSQSLHDSKGSVTKATKTEQQQTGVNGGIPDITLVEAVEFCRSLDTKYQKWGASFIQHATFSDDSARCEVRRLIGIPALVALLESEDHSVSQCAAAALRNVVFKDNDNKMEVQKCEGIEPALKLLKETNSSETQKQLTGLLWNLSSAEFLKGELITSALPVLTESVLKPFTCWSETSANNNVHPDVFYNATGCLRNLSSAKKDERQAMRQCPGLVDSIMAYVQSCVEEDKCDDKSVENCACILHNLSYQLETEAPECFERITQRAQSSDGRRSPTVGCFSPRSTKIHKTVFDMVDSSAPAGVGWLSHPKALQTYLDLLGSSQKDATLEAACGALQNLTANKGEVCDAMGQTIVKKLGGIQNITPLLQSPNVSLQKTAVSLVGNLARSPPLHPALAQQILPDLATLISSGKDGMGNSDDTIATACYAVRSLLPANAEISKKVVNNELVTSLTELSENVALSKGSKAAALLLYSLWNDKSLQGSLKKLGMAKTQFVNDNTTAVHRSMQVVE